MASVDGHWMNDLIECPVCTCDDGIPKSLPCGHTLCQKCLQDMVHQQQEPSISQRIVMGSSTGNQRDILKCPMCRASIKVPPGGVANFPNNTTIVQLRDKMKSSTISKKVSEPEQKSKGTRESMLKEACGMAESDDAVHTCDMCAETDRRPAVGYCKNCHQYSCSMCTASHQKRKLFAGHKVIKVTNNKHFCPSHVQSFRYVCSQCWNLLCVGCITAGKCDGHDVQELASMAPSMERELNHIIEDIKKDLESHTAEKLIQVEVDRKIEKLEEEFVVLEKHTQKIVNKILQRKEKIMTELKKDIRELENARQIGDDGIVMEQLIQMRDLAEAALVQGQGELVTIVPVLKVKREGIGMRNRKSSILDVQSCRAFQRTLRFKGEDSITLGDLVDVESKEQTLKYLPNPSATAEIPPCPKGPSKGTAFVQKLFERPEWKSKPSGNAKDLPNYSAIAQIQKDARNVGATNSLQINYDAPPKFAAIVRGFEHVSGMAFLPDGSVVVCDRNLRLIRQYDMKGALLKDSLQVGVRFGQPGGIAYHPGLAKILVVDSQLKAIHKLQLNSLKHMGLIKLQGFTFPHAICVMPNNNVVISDMAQSSFSVINLTTERFVLSSITSEHLKSPTALAAQDSNTVLVFDFKENIVFTFYKGVLQVDKVTPINHKVLAMCKAPGHKPLVLTSGGSKNNCYETRNAPCLAVWDQTGDSIEALVGLPTLSKLNCTGTVAQSDHQVAVSFHDQVFLFTLSST